MNFDEDIDPDNYLGADVRMNGHIKSNGSITFTTHTNEYIPPMTKSELIVYIDYMRNQPVALSTENNTREKNITEGIIGALTWVLRFIDFYNRSFKTKDGEYKKSGFLKAVGIAGAIFKLGLELINLKKRKL